MFRALFQWLLVIIFINNLTSLLLSRQLTLLTACFPRFFIALFPHSLKLIKKTSYETGSPMWQYSICLLKAGFHMIADDRRSQKVLRSYGNTLLRSSAMVIAGENVMYLVSSWIFFEGKTDVSFDFEADVVVALGLKEEINCSKTSMLFALIFPRAQRACTIDISAERNVWLQSALRSFAITAIWKQLSLRSSAIFCDHMETSLKTVRVRKWSQDRKWSRTANDPQIGPQMIPDRKWSRPKK